MCISRHFRDMHTKYRSLLASRILKALSLRHDDDILMSEFRKRSNPAPPKITSKRKKRRTKAPLPCSSSSSSSSPSSPTSSSSSSSSTCSSTDSSSMTCSPSALPFSSLQSFPSTWKFVLIEKKLFVSFDIDLPLPSSPQKQQLRDIFASETSKQNDQTSTKQLVWFDFHFPCSPESIFRFYHHLTRFPRAGLHVSVDWESDNVPRSRGRPPEVLKVPALSQIGNSDNPHTQHYRKEGPSGEVCTRKSATHQFTANLPVAMEGQFKEWLEGEYIAWGGMRGKYTFNYTPLYHQHCLTYANGPIWYQEEE